MSLRIDVITLFPGLFPGPLGVSIPGRALSRGLAELHAHDLRAWGIGRHRSVDDYPYGGGAGMVLRPEPIADALAAVAPAESNAIRILFDPGGRPFDQAIARELARKAHLVLVAPRYEGVDERVRSMVDLELSIGDYILSGGDLPALVLIDAVLRLLPGAIDQASSVEESFSEGLLEYPQYTRPPAFGSQGVPEVLISGHHGEVARWRREQSLERTRRVRPDLIRGLGDGSSDLESRPPSGLPQDAEPASSEPATSTPATSERARAKPARAKPGMAKPAKRRTPAILRDRQPDA